MLNFIDRSITKFVAEEKGHVIVIQKDYLNPTKWEFSIYKDTEKALGSDLITAKNNISSLVEAKMRAAVIFKQILSSNGIQND